MSGISLDEIVFSTGAGATDADTLRVQLSDESLAALENITVSATDLDIRDLSFATDSVDVSGSTVELGATSLAALENITVTVDNSSIEISNDVGNPIPVSGTVSVAPAGSDTIKSSAETVTTTAAEVLATPLTGRASVIIQNEGNKDVYVGSTSGVTTATGIKISRNSSATLDVSDSADIFMIADSGSQSVRFLEIGA